MRVTNKFSIKKMLFGSLILTGLIILKETEAQAVVSTSSSVAPIDSTKVPLTASQKAAYKAKREMREATYKDRQTKEDKKEVDYMTKLHAKAIANKQQEDMRLAKAKADSLARLDSSKVGK